MPRFIVGKMRLIEFRAYLPQRLYIKAKINPLAQSAQRPSLSRTRGPFSEKADVSLLFGTVPKCCR